MRDGDTQRYLTPAKKSELERVFKGKHNKLEAWSYLNPNGLFLQALQAENKTEFPHLETRALWVGELRKKHGEDFTNTHEDDCFNFVFADTTNNRLSKDDFFELVEKRISWGEARLFPECSEMKCEPVENLKEKGLQGEMYKKLNQIQKELDVIKERFITNKQALKIYTEPEQEAIRKLGKKLQDEKSRIKRDLKVSEEAPGLFGLNGLENIFTEAKFKIPFFTGITKNEIKSVFLNRNSSIISGEDSAIIGFSSKMRFLWINFSYKNSIVSVRSCILATEPIIKKNYCYG